MSSTPLLLPPSLPPSLSLPLLLPPPPPLFFPFCCASMPHAAPIPGGCMLWRYWAAAVVDHSVTIASACGLHAACMPAPALCFVLYGAGALSEHPTFLQNLQHTTWDNMQRHHHSSYSTEAVCDLGRAPNLHCHPPAHPAHSIQPCLSGRLIALQAPFGGVQQAKDQACTVAVGGRLTSYRALPSMRPRKWYRFRAWAVRLTAPGSGYSSWSSVAFHRPLHHLWLSTLHQRHAAVSCTSAQAGTG